MSRVRHRGAASQERRSWRQPSLARQPGSSRIRGLRWLLTLLALLLIVLFVIWVRPSFREGRHLVAIAIWATDPLAVRPIPCAAEDIAALRRIRDVTPQQSIGLQERASFGKLGGQLRAIAKPRDELLALYLVAHGISDGDQAYIVCSDFSRAEGSGTYPVRDLLAEFATCPGKLKLLVLDAGRLGYEPRLGMAANEFARLIVRDVTALPRQELWVLLPCGPLERTAVALPWRQSVFGHSVAEGLQGAANRDAADGYVTLYELYEHVRTESARWADGSGQTPLLIKAGQGLIQPGPDQDDQDHRLVWVHHDEPESEPAEQPNPPAQVSAGDPPPGTSAGPSKPADPAVAAATPPTPPADTPAAAAGGQAVGGQAAGGQAAGGQAAGGQAAGGQAAGEPQKPAGPPADASRPAAQTESPAAADPQAVATRSEDQSAATKPAEPGSAQNRRLLVTMGEAWALRDELQAAQADPEHWPIHVAPHLWRELNALLLHYEQSIWAGIPLTSQGGSDQDLSAANAGLEQELDLLRSDLRALKNRWAAPAEAGPARFRHDVFRRLEQARRQSSDAPGGGSAISQSSSAADQLPEVQQIRAAAYGWNRLTFQALDYIRWFDLASYSQSSPLPIFEDLQRYLEGLAAFQTRLAALQTRSWSSEELAALSEVGTEFDILLAQRDGLERQLKIIEQNALAALEQTRNQQQIEDLLATPRLPAERRGHLLQALLATSVALPPIRNVPPAAVGLSSGRPQRLLERLELDARWIRLVDPRVSDDLQRQISELGETLSAIRPDEERFWEQCRRAGRTLRDFYTALPGRPEYVALHLVEPLDAGRMSVPAAAFKFQLEIRVEPRLKLQGPERQRLDFGRWSPVSITLRANQRELLNRAPQLVYDPDLLEVKPDPEEGPVEGQSGWYEQVLTWQVSARADKDAAGRSEAELTFAADAPGGRRETHRLSLLLPQPNRIDLQVLREGSATAIADDGSSVALDLFPNRTTSYQLGLVNLSGVERQVEVSLYALPARHRSHAAPGKISAAVRRAVLAGGSVDAAPVTASPVPLTLPASDRPVPLTLLTPPQAAPDPGGDPAAAAPKLQPAPEQKFTAVDISQGLLCVVRDRADAQHVWTKWIEWRVVAPRRFLDAEVGYDGRRREIVARVQAKDFDRDVRPDLPAGDPVQLAWVDDEHQLPGEGRKQLLGKLQAGGEVELFAAAPADNQKRLVRLDVDDYPRGLLYEVPCTRSEGDFRPGSDIRADRRVRINRLVAADFPYEFHFPPYARWPAAAPKPAAPGEPPPLTPVRVAQDGYVVLPAPSPQLRIDFEVDAPVDAFLDAEDRIVVALGHGTARSLELFEDRQATAELIGLGQDGRYEFRTAVSDYSVDFAPGALQNMPTYLEVQLSLPGIGEARDRVQLALVADPPAVDTVQLLSAATREEFPKQLNVYQVPQGARLLARVQVRTLAGVRYAEYAFAVPGGDPPDGAKLYRPDAPPPVDRRQVLDVPLDTKGLDQDRYRLVLGVRDLADHDSRPQEVDLRFVPPAQAAPVKGSITGRVCFGPNHSSVQGSPPYKVTLTGTGGQVRTVTAQPDGSFQFADLPPGEYTLTATGTFLNRLAEGKLEGIQPSPPGTGQKVPLVVDRRQ